MKIGGEIMEDSVKYQASYEDPKRNHEGYADPTAYEALKHVDRPSEAEEERFHKLLHTLRDVCELSGFKIEGRIVLVDKANGRVWR
jgi:hypothetical protein